MPPKTPTQPRAMTIVKGLTVILAEDDRARDLKPWIAALAAAEAEAAKAPQARARLYLVNYRIRDPDSDTEGPESARRSALVEIIRSRAPLEVHQSTSTWLLELHIASAAEVARLLARPLDRDIDYLHVAEVTENRARFGKVRVKS